MEYSLDVSELEPCEPLERTLAALRQLKKGDCLKVLHRREPHLLFPLLEKQGFSWSVETGATTPFVILIWHSDGAIPDMSADRS